MQYFSMQSLFSDLLNLLRLVKSIQSGKLFHRLTTLLVCYFKKKLSLILLTSQPYHHGT